VSSAAVGNFSLLSKPTAIAWTGTASNLQTVPDPSLPVIRIRWSA
jgi:hypothetical protein